MTHGTEDALRDPARLDALHATGLLDTLPEESFDRLTRLATRVMDAPVSLVSLVDEHRQFLKSAVGVSEPLATARQTPISHSFCQYVVSDAEPLVVSDARHDPRLRDNPAIPDYDVIAYAGVPLVTRDGFVLGSFCAIDSRPRQWSEEEVSALKDLARAVITEIELRAEIAERERGEEIIGQLASIVEHSSDAILSYSLDGIITSWNAAAEKLYGYTAEEAIGQPKAMLTPPDEENDVPALLARIVRGELVEHYETRRLRRDGTIVEVALTVSPIRDATGEVVAASVIARDVTGRREVERLKDEFVSLVSHELRTPLTSIRGSLGLLVSGHLGTLPEKGQRMLEIASQNADRLVRLINGILDAERLAADDRPIEGEPASVGDLLGLAAETMRAQAEAGDVALRVGTAEVEVRVDRDQLMQVLINLLSNAIKFSPPGAVVDLMAERDGSGVRISVVDRGRGIPPAKVDVLFGRFQQVDPSDARDKGGSGLGLFISQRIVQRHGGRIRVESVPGEGSTFWFTLPGAGER